MNLVTSTFCHKKLVLIRVIADERSVIMEQGKPYNFKWEDDDLFSFSFVSFSSS